MSKRNATYLLSTGRNPGKTTEHLRQLIEHMGFSGTITVATVEELDKLAAKDAEIDLRRREHLETCKLVDAKDAEIAALKTVLVTHATDVQLLKAESHAQFLELHRVKANYLNEREKEGEDMTRVVEAFKAECARLRARLEKAEACAHLLADLTEGSYRDRNEPLWPRAKEALAAWRDQAGEGGG